MSNFYPLISRSLICLCLGLTVGFNASANDKKLCKASATESLSLPVAKVQNPLRLPEANYSSKGNPFKVSKWVLKLITEPFRSEISENLDERMTQFLESRQYKDWFNFQDSILKGLDKDILPTEVMVKQVRSPQEGLLAKLAMINQAKYSIDISYYIFKNDPTGYSILEALKQAIDRGVNVRVMVDSLGSMKLYHGELKALRYHAEQLKKQAGDKGRILDENGNLTEQYAHVETLVFNPLIKLGQTFRYFIRNSMNLAYWMVGSDKRIPSIKTWFNRRTHDKVLLVDGRFPELAIAIFGGRNVSNSYYGIPKVDSETYMDHEVIIKNIPGRSGEVDPTKDIGTIVSNWYDKLYFYQGNKFLMTGIVGWLTKYKYQYKRMEKAYREIDQVSQETQLEMMEIMDDKDFGKSYLEFGWIDAKADLVYELHNLYRRNASQYEKIRENENNNSKLFEVNGIVSTISKHIANEQERIAIISPYLWLSKSEITSLKEWLAVDPKRKLDIYTNSVLTSDNMLAQALVDTVLGPELIAKNEFKDQVKVYEYGRLDAKELGGDKAYGKLHQKGVLLYGQNLVFEGTSNKDPRSQLLNSEVGLIIESKDYAVSEMIPVIDKLRAESHEWNSKEYHEIRSHKNLPGFKKYVVKRQSKLYWLLVHLNLWWLI
ncbi:MAG: phospholipase D-like domain-containing protein [Bdellovibrionota bacterium]|nr:phospholipase D-like domain-containing protein [Bdellovibrionota bacterium]